MIVKLALALFLLAALPAVFFAQGKRNARTAAPAPTPASTPQPKNTPAQKRNERPNSDGNSDQTRPAQAQPPNYFYQFERPGFTYPSISIEHDEAGRGQITFVRTGNDVAVADPVGLSPSTLKNIKDAFSALNFLDSTETYQTPRDYSTMGNVTITVKRDGRSRTVKFNWTDNKQARILADEYRRISNEYIWRFEIASARENQPLLAPQLMQQMDDYLRRNEISDPAALVPLLRELSNDERIPLIARDRAGKLADQIQKTKK